MLLILKKSVLILSALALFSSCAGGVGLSGNRKELPEEQVALLAAQIEDAVLYSNPAPDAASVKADEKPGEESGGLQPLDVIMSPDEIREKAPALSQLHADTEEMLSAIRGRVLRRPAVYELEQTGCLGETRDGFIKVVKGKMCTGDKNARERSAYIVLLENRDRRIIFEQTAEALEQSGTSRIQQIFAEQMVKKAWAGTPIETAAGTWEKK